MTRRQIDRQIDHWLDQLVEARTLADVQVCVEMLAWLRSKLA